MDNQDIKEQFLQAQMIQGQAFDEMIRSQGWEYAKAWYQEQMKDFINSLMAGDRPIAEFETSRQQLIGFKSFLSYIDDAINALKTEREKNEKPA